MYVCVCADENHQTVHQTTKIEFDIDTWKIINNSDAKSLIWLENVADATIAAASSWAICATHGIDEQYCRWMNSMLTTQHRFAGTKAASSRNRCMQVPCKRSGYFIPAFSWCRTFPSNLWFDSSVGSGLFSLMFVSICVEWEQSHRSHTHRNY